MPPRQSIPADDLYARLEVPADATSEAIEIAWRALLKRHHPDVAGSAALDLAKRINVAHDWLSDPALRKRYDRERTDVRHDARRDGWAARTAPVPRYWRPAPLRRRPADAAAMLRRFLDRVASLSPVELDRLSVADTSSIAFVASIRRFLAPAQVGALEAVERDVRDRLRPADWAAPAVRDAILAAAHELVLAPFLDKHLTEPFRGRARDRLMRGWEAAIGQPRYGPNSAAVERFVERCRQLARMDLDAMLTAAGRAPFQADAWPAGLDPEEDEGLRVSSTLAARDAAAAAAPAVAALAAFDRSDAARAARLLGRTAHALVLRHAFGAEEFTRLVGPWQAATGDPGTGRGAGERAEPLLRRRQGPG